MSIRLRNIHAGFTHFDTYNKEPNSDCNCLFEQNFLFFHWLHMSIILSSLSDMVMVSVLIRIPRQTKEVDGAIKFFGLMVRPNWVKSSNKVSKD